MTLLCDFFFLIIAAVLIGMIFFMIFWFFLISNDDLFMYLLHFFLSASFLFLLFAVELCEFFMYLDINLLSDLCFATTFSHLLGCLYTELFFVVYIYFIFASMTEKSYLSKLDDIARIQKLFSSLELKFGYLIYLRLEKV